MNGLVLCTGANKTVGSLEFSKTRLQPLVKPRKRGATPSGVGAEACCHLGGSGQRRWGRESSLQNRDPKHLCVCTENKNPNEMQSEMQFSQNENNFHDVLFY